MTWTRLNDNWTESPALEELSFEDRWHYLALIQRCSRSEAYDGLIRGVDARRCSDHPDPAAAIAHLVDAHLLAIIPGGKYKVIHIDDHVPPPSVRMKTENDKIRQRRKRAHDNGDHGLCKPDADCVTGSVTRDTGRDVRTGQDRTGRDEEKYPVSTMEWPTVQPYAGLICEVCTEPIPEDSPVSVCAKQDDLHDHARGRAA